MNDHIITPNSASPPDAELVQMLTAALEWAKAGKLRACVLAATMPNFDITRAIHLPQRSDVDGLLGALRIIEHRLIIMSGAANDP